MPKQKKEINHHPTIMQYGYEEAQSKWRSLKEPNLL